MSGIFLKIIGQLGGRKWLTTLITGALTPMLAVYLPVAIVTPVVASLTALAISFVFVQGAVDKATGGASSTSHVVIKSLAKKK